MGINIVFDTMKKFIGHVLSGPILGKHNVGSHAAREEADRELLVFPVVHQKEVRRKEAYARYFAYVRYLWIVSREEYPMHWMLGSEPWKLEEMQDWRDLMAHGTTVLGTRGQRGRETDETAGESSEQMQMGKQILQLYSLTEKLDARVERVEQQQKERDIPTYVSEEFAAINENLIKLKDGHVSKEVVLFHMGELEALFGKVESKARASGRKYEGRLASCLRDVCWVNEPHALSGEQLTRLCAAGQVLLQGWGKLTREKNNWTIKTLVEVGLSILPVTDKVAAELEGADA